MIKVCHIADHLNGEIDGVFKHITTIIKETDHINIQHFLCFQGGRKIEEEIIKIGGNIILLPELSSKIPFISIIKFIKICKQNNFNVIHTHYLKSYIVAGLSNIFLKVKVIFNYHGLFINNEFYSFFEKKIIQLVHLLICKLNCVQVAIVPAKESELELLKETRLFPQVRQYYNGGNPAIKFTQHNQSIIQEILKIQSFKLAFIGRVEEEKRIDRAIDILFKLISRGLNIHLFIIGSGSLMNKMVQISEDFNLKHSITFLGYIPNPETYLKYFDSLIITSEREGLPFALWEAMSEGLPIVSSSVGGIPEILNEAKCGILFHKNDISEAVEKINILIQDKELRERFSLNGKKAIVEKYNVKNFKVFIEKLYYDLA